MALPQRVALPSLGTVIDQQRERRGTQQARADAGDPASRGSRPKAAPSAHERPVAATDQSAKIADRPASPDDQLLVKTSVSVPVVCRERLRDLATATGRSQADALVVAMSEFATRKNVDTQVETLGDFVVKVATVEVPRTIVTLRLSKTNLAAMDRLQEQLGLSSRSDLVTRVLQH